MQREETLDQVRKFWTIFVQSKSSSEISKSNTKKSNCSKNIKKNKNFEKLCYLVSCYIYFLRHTNDSPYKSTDKASYQLSHKTSNTGSNKNSYSRTYISSYQTPNIRSYNGSNKYFNIVLSFQHLYFVKRIQNFFNEILKYNENLSF